MNILPSFEVNGQSFEIKKTRYLLAEYQQIGKQNELSNKEKENVLKSRSLMVDIKNYAEKVKELEGKYFETFDDEDERKYLKIKALYDKKLEEFARFEVETGSASSLQDLSFKVLEKIAIKGVAEQYFNFDEVKAKAIWEEFCNTISRDDKEEWLVYMSSCLFDKEEEKGNDNSFLSQMRRQNLNKNKKK